MIVKAGSTQFTVEDARRIYESKKYVCNYSGIYAPHYSVNGGYHFTKVSNEKGYASRGRFYIQDAKTVNSVLGYKLLIED